MRKQRQYWRIQLFSIALLVGFTAAPSWATSFAVKALLRGQAVIEVDGEQKLLKVGDSFAGVTLIEANAKVGVFEVDGVRKTLGVGRHMGANYATPERTAVRIASQHGGHYFAPGRINQQPVTFLVDTGATTIAMNSEIASQLGINYLAGRVQHVQTAGGVVAAYQVMLDSAAIGSLLLHNVEASVLVGPHPAQVLLGNSYLSRVDMRVDNGVLVLQAKY